MSTKVVGNATQDPPITSRILSAVGCPKSGSATGATPGPQMTLQPPCIGSLSDDIRICELLHQSSIDYLYFLLTRASGR